MFTVAIGAGITAAGILGWWNVKEYILHYAVTNLTISRRPDMFPLVSGGQGLETNHEYLIEV